MERPSRRNASKAAKAEAATAGLKSLKENGLKRFDTVAEAEDNNVYDVVRALSHAHVRMGSSAAFLFLLFSCYFFSALTASTIHCNPTSHSSNANRSSPTRTHVSPGDRGRVRDARQQASSRIRRVHRRRGRRRVRALPPPPHAYASHPLLSTLRILLVCPHQPSPS